ncbi:MAG: hypothetical protein WCT49_00020 [Candidatus Paceibacterota bacterium]|jgi:hypothetical protein|nr:hypothetical protein [Candidatus Paceibacterota bacterium]
MKKQIIIGIIAILVLAGLGWFLAEKNKGEKPVPMQTKSPIATEPTITKVDEHLTIDETLRDVNFCGKTYKVKQVMIDGVDVVQRIAELATKGLIPATLKDGPYGPPNQEYWKTVTLKKGEMAKEICENPSLNALTRETKVVQITHIGKTPNISIGPSGAEGYGFLVNGGYSFVVFPTTYDIYKGNDYTGGVFGPIGKLK